MLSLSTQQLATKTKCAAFLSCADSYLTLFAFKNME